MGGEASRRDWLGAERDALAAERILDAAGRVFARRGGPHAEMADIAAEAGCSRATLYRYFDGRRALRVAYLHREAQRVVREVHQRAAAISDPAERLTETILAAVRAVRATPALASWFTAGAAGPSTSPVSSSPVLEALSATFFEGPADDDTRSRARWLVRAIVSLLTMPGDDPTEERAVAERFVQPVLRPLPQGRGRP